MGRYKKVIRSRRPGKEEWGTVSWFVSDSEFQTNKEAEQALVRWKSAAMDHKSPLYNWEFKIADL